MDDNQENNGLITVVELKKRQRKFPTEEEMLVSLFEARRKRGIITKFPKFIPSPRDPEGTILSMTPEEQDKVLEDMLSHPEKLIIKHDIYKGSAQKIDQLSLQEVDDIARRNASYLSGIRKKVASSSKRPMTNA